MTFPQMSREDLDRYLAHITKQKIHYKTEARGTSVNDKTLKELDDMACYAIARYYGLQEPYKEKENVT